MGQSWDPASSEKAQLETIASDRSNTNALRARVASAALSMLKGIKNEVPNCPRPTRCSSL